MRQTKRIKNIGVPIICLLIAAVLCFCSIFSFDEQQGTDDFGMYTFDRELTLSNGETVGFYESGDQYYHYFHDENGFILMLEDGDLYYAQNENGRPVPSNVSYTDSQMRINSVQKMVVSDVDLAKNTDLLQEYPVEDDVIVDSILNSAENSVEMANIVIFIVFSDESVGIDTARTQSYMDGSVSVANYFYKASDGRISVTGYYPKSGDAIYVYQAEKPRSYYTGLTDFQRGQCEARLLTKAVNSVNSYLSFNGADVDTNDDGYVDSVSFIIGGSSSSTWGSLLWPHSWNLASINKSYNASASAKINGVSVGEFSFNFLDSLNVGVLCHEYFHVLGAPDLYHYDYDFVPVGDWDIMQFNADVPQLPLTYMRYKYLGISGDRIGEITKNGIFSLSPTINADSDEYLAYKIDLGIDGEYFMVEYRNLSVASTYDTSLPMSGLLVYRVKENVSEGNRNALYQDEDNPDEVYIFRPHYASTGRETNSDVIYSVSRTDVKYAALSPDNAYFSSVGASLSAKPNSSYDFSTVFYSDGSNSGIVISALSISEDSIEFKVQITENEVVDDGYFDGKIELISAELQNLGYAGVNVKLLADNLDLSTIQSVSVSLRNDEDKIIATNTVELSKFIKEYNASERVFECPFVINDKGNAISSVFNAGSINTNYEPKTASISVVDADGDEIVVDTCSVSDAALTWAAVLATKTELQASISASSRITLGVTKNGTVYASGDRTDGQWNVESEENVSAAAAGYTHTALLTTAQKVVAVGTNAEGECNVSSWSNIMLIAAGYNATYGVDVYGKVRAVGSSDYNKLDVSGWANVISISAGVRHVAAVSSNGTVYAVGDNTDGQCNTSAVTDAVSVACGSTFTAVLHKDGSVSVCGKLNGGSDVAQWSGITKLSAGENFLVGLKDDFTLVAAGVNDAGQCNVSGYVDIIDIAAGEYHTAMLRNDGVVQFCGSTDGEYGVSLGIGNLMIDNYIAATSITLDTDTQIMYAGTPNSEQAQSNTYCSVKVYPENATYKRIIFKSSDTTVATVSDSGYVHAVGAGTVTVTATLNGSDIEESVTFEVLQYVEVSGIEFVDSNLIVMVNGSATLRLNYNPTEASVLYKPVFSLVTLDESGNPLSATEAATINESGVFTAKNMTYTVRVTARYYQNNKEHIATCLVRIVSEVEKIVISSNPTKNVYYYGEDFDVSGGVVTIIYRVETGSEPTTQSITAEMISGYDKYVIGIQTITIKYLDVSAIMSVEVKNKVQSVSFARLPQTEFKYGESLDLSLGTIAKNMINGDTLVSAIPSTAQAEGYSSSTVGIQTVTLTISVDGAEYTLVYDVRVLDKAIAVSAAYITKTAYSYGESLYMTDNLLLTMISGAQRMIQFDNSAVTVTGFDTSVCGYHQLDIAYYDSANDLTVSTTLAINVSLDGIFRIFTLDSAGNRHEYSQTVYFYLGGELPLEVYYYSDDESISAKVTTDTTANLYYAVTAFDNLATAKQENVAVEIKYLNRVLKKDSAESDAYVATEYLTRVSQTITAFGELQVVSRDVIGDTTINYGEPLELKLKLTDSGGATTLIDLMSDDSATLSYNEELTGVEQNCRILYHNEAVTVKITLTDYVLGLEDLEDIEVKYGEAPTIEVYALWAKAGRVLLSQGEYTLSQYSVTTLGEQTVTVSYGVNTVDFKLKVTDGIANVVCKKALSTTCKYGEPLITDAVFTYTMLSGATLDVNFNTDEFSVTEFNSGLVDVAQTVKIVHLETGKEFSFIVKAVDYVKSIAVASGAKTVYTYGEALDFSINVTMATGRKTVVALSQCSVSGYNATVIGTQTVVIEYMGASTTVKASVQDAVSKLTLTAPAKTVYEYGEALKPWGGTLVVNYESGAVERFENEQLLSVDCSYDPTKTGRQTVTFSVGGATAFYVVTVAAKTADTFDIAASNGINIASSELKLECSLKASELSALVSLADYLQAGIKTADGEYIALSQLGDDYLRSDSTFVVVNANGQTVFKNAICLAGDGNGDGILDENDLDYLAQSLLSGNASTSLTDYDKDGTYSLTDLINWARKLAGGNSPIANAARRFISDVKPRKEEVYEY